MCKHTSKPVQMETCEKENAVEESTGTRAAVDAFLAHRSEVGYGEVLEAFVFESMATERCAFFPTSTNEVSGKEVP